MLSALLDVTSSAQYSVCIYTRTEFESAREGRTLTQANYSSICCNGSRQLTCSGNYVGDHLSVVILTIDYKCDINLNPDYLITM